MNNCKTCNKELIAGRVMLNICDSCYGKNTTPIGTHKVEVLSMADFNRDVIRMKETQEEEEQTRKLIEFFEGLSRGS